MSKARTLADFISDGSEFADGTISVAEVSGAAPLASPTFTGTASGTFSGPLTGNVTGNVTGDLTGDVTGNVTGNLTGNVTGDVAGDIDLSAIAATIADTAVDIFVYDTRKDSDGGAWRKRTQGTSWYNETLNTATRGSRKEFPAVAVIVAESGTVTIYDGDDPDMPMWMVFNKGGSYPSAFILGRSVPNNTSVASLNGVLAVGIDTSGYGEALSVINFVSDSAVMHTSASSWRNGQDISGRNTSTTLTVDSSVGNIISLIVNDVAMTVLPNAPIDAATGLPVPTIAVATNAGVSVIRDDGNVVDINYGSYNASKMVSFTDNNGLFASFDNVIANSRYGKVWNTIPSSDLVVAGTPYNQANGEDANYSAAAISVYSPEGYLRVNRTTVTNSSPSSEGIDFAIPQGVTRLATYETSPDKGMFSLIASDYNTGWMNGDIKLATLSDTDDTNVTGSELVTNGDFSSGTTGWNAYNAVISVSSGQMTVDDTANAGSNSSAISNGISLAAGTYTISVEVISTTDSAYIAFTTNNSGTPTGSWNVAANVPAGVYSKTITVTGTSTYYVWLCTNGTSVTVFDNISVRLAEEDRSVNGNGLQVFGTVTKSAVATGADLVAYDGFMTTGNYLQQPYNSDLDFGTGDYCFMAWVYGGDTSSRYAVTRGGPNGGGSDRLIFLRANSGYYNFGVYDGQTRTITGPAVADRWTQLCGLRRNGNTEFYADGVLQGTNTNTPNMDGGTDHVLRIGYGTWDSGKWNGKVSLVRISATAPSPEQIAKIYNDEKFLFQENAQATLYGSSDAVTALAHDDSTDLLHVGTSAGRSVFQGLRRVDNTTTAVGAAISASNGLVADE